MMEKDDRSQVLVANEVGSSSNTAKKVATVTATATSEKGPTVLHYNYEQYYTMDDIQLRQQQRDGGEHRHSCCGGRCDMRRAVIIVDVLWAILGLLALCKALVFYSNVKRNNNGDEYTNMARQEMLFALLSLIAMGLSIAGAVRRNRCLVGVGALYFIGIGLCMLYASLLFALWLYFVAGFALLAYPHVMFILEERRGIMSVESDEQERHSSLQS